MNHTTANRSFSDLYNQYESDHLDKYEVERMHYWYRWLNKRDRYESDLCKLIDSGQSATYHK